MQFLSEAQCQHWIAAQPIKLPHAGVTKADLRLQFPKSPFAFYSWARRVSSSITFERPSLLWIVEWGIWESSENWNLYERVKRGYGDIASLPDKPGHLFDGDELDDLVTFFQLSMMFGWGGYLLTEANRANAFISHDEFVDVYSTDGNLMMGLKESLGS
jgi:hypothetical protein